MLPVSTVACLLEIGLGYAEPPCHFRAILRSCLLCWKLFEAMQNSTILHRVILRARSAGSTFPRCLIPFELLFDIIVAKHYSASNGLPVVSHHVL